MHVLRNIEARSCNHCCSGKAISITYSVSVFVALGIQHVMRLHHIVICGLSCCAIVFLPYLINGTIFEKKVITRNMCVDSLYYCCLKHVLF